jgi:hypothetical protein
MDEKKTNMSWETHFLYEMNGLFIYIKSKNLNYKKIFKKIKKGGPQNLLIRNEWVIFIYKK